MKKQRKAMWTPSTELQCLLIVLYAAKALTVCPPICVCTRSHRVVDCSGRNLSDLPEGLQHNIQVLNLSHNSLVDLDNLLTHLGHLRTLDISHNQFSYFPRNLPKALWEIDASGNTIRLLEKTDTAYHWNLKLLDLSGNAIERIVFINNTLTNLRSLNLSGNKFWTVPTNMPYNLETVDLSNNLLVQILPGSLDRLPHLAFLYLHNNRFATIEGKAFSKLASLKLITLNDNPWVCDREKDIDYLLFWVRQTSARVIGCPCFTSHICGQGQTTSMVQNKSSKTTFLSSTNRAWRSPLLPTATSNYLLKSATAAVLVATPSNISTVQPPLIGKRSTLTYTSTILPNITSKNWHTSTTPNSTPSAEQKTLLPNRATYSDITIFSTALFNFTLVMLTKSFL
ncbi:oligodendrocyte-myelin glycoprotein [Erpetoichthys calabaricus]|uniref:oligodendrocyte-myelin glycoprotein n=1 Tax=Erpetoichthys calabaricus TaxID=27687 RepID=UPI002233EDAB|nr:oligodendrocyte-myelin glycoprotein [Erpetoichthys calabaricus]